MKMKLLLAALAAVVLGTGCNWKTPTTSEESGPKPNLTIASFVSSSPVVGSQVKKGDNVAVTISAAYDVTALLSQNIQPRLFAHRAGDPTTALVGGMMFPSGDSYMELPPKGNLTLIFDGDVGGRAFYDAEPGSTIDYVILAFMYRTAAGRLDFVTYNVDGKTDMDSRPIYLNWNVK